MKAMKKIHYRLAVDGFRFDASTPEEVCSILWNSMKFRWDDSLQEWIEHNAFVWAHRCKLRTDTAGHHVEDMVANGILQVLPDEFN